MSSPIIFGPNGATSLVPGGVTLPGSTSGTLQIEPAAATTSYAVKMPAAQGAASTVLQNDGAGNLSWSVASGSGSLGVNYYQTQYNTLSSTSYTGVTPIKFTTQVYDTSNSFNTSTGQYTVPLTGYYKITIGFEYLASGGSNVDMYIYKNGVQQPEGIATTGALARAYGTGNIYAAAGDLLDVRLLLTSTFGSTDGFIMFEYVAPYVFGNGSVLPAPSAPTTTILTSGSGTYTVPANAIYLRIRMAGAGAGGWGSGSSAGGSPSNGGNTTFGTGTAFGGAISGNYNSGTGGPGGSATLGIGWSGAAITGGQGDGSDYNGGTGDYVLGGNGGMNPLAGAAGMSAGGSDAGTTSPNTGAGGSGGSSGAIIGTGFNGGAGGGAGGYIDAIIPSPSGSYSYSVGTAGSLGSPGTGGHYGGNGSAGIIIIDAFYPVAITSSTGTAGVITTQVFTSGSGTYSRPANVTNIRVRMVGGGAGGSGSTTSSSQGAGGNGGTTTFGPFTATGGTGASATNFSTGGTVSFSGGTVLLALTGATGSGSGFNNTAGAGLYIGGGVGGGSPFGGAGAGGVAGATGYSATSNTGAGGGGGSSNGSNGIYTGAGGGAGGYLEAYISSPASTYSYTIGSGGAGGVGYGTGTSNGGNGAAGIIIVEEFYAAPTASVAVNPITTVTTSTATLTTANNFVIVNYPSGTCNITIPGGAAAGLVFNIKTVTAQNVIVTPTSGTVDGSSTLTISGQYTSANIVSDGTNYWVV